MCIRGRGKDISGGVVDLDVTPSASYPGRWSTSRSCVTRGSSISGIDGIGVIVDSRRYGDDGCDM